MAYKVEVIADPRQPYAVMASYGRVVAKFCGKEAAEARAAWLNETLRQSLERANETRHEI